MSRTFAEEKFLGNMKLAVLIAIASYFMSILDYVLIGHSLGENALEAFAFATPYLTIITFASSIVSAGTAYMIALEVGKGSREKADHYYQQGILLGAVFGVVLGALFFIVGKNVVFGMDMNDEVKGMLVNYFHYVCFLPILQIMNTLLFGIIWNEGGDRYCNISLGIQVLLKVGLSVILMKYMKLAGISVSSIISFLVADLVLALYLRSEENVFHWQFYWNWSAIRDIFRFSQRDSLLYLYVALLQFFMNLFLMSRYGGSAVLIFSVVMNMENLYFTFFNVPANAISVILNVFVGERNRKGILRVMKTARKVSVIEGICVMVILLVFAEWIPRAFGIASSVNVARAAFAIRIFAVLAIVFPFIMLYSLYFLSIREILLSIGSMTMQLLIMPLLCSIVFSNIWGMNGVWIGFVTGSILMFFVSMFRIWRSYQHRTFPHLMDKEKLEEQFSYDIPISKEDVMGLVEQVQQDLTERGVDKSKMYKIMLMIEETEMLVVEKNQGKKGRIQCDIYLEDPIRLVLRDSGPFSDVTDQGGEVDSFRVYTSSMIIGANRKNRYLKTWGNNRVVYTIS